MSIVKLFSEPGSYGKCIAFREVGMLFAGGGSFCNCADTGGRGILSCYQPSLLNAAQPIDCIKPLKNY